MAEGPSNYLTYCSCFGHSVIFLINFFYFQFSVSQSTWQIWQTNQTNQIESWIKHRCCAWVRKRVCHHRSSNSWPRAWLSIPMIRAESDTTQLFKHPVTLLFYFWGAVLAADIKPVLALFFLCATHKRKKTSPVWTLAGHLQICHCIPKVWIKYFDK